MRAEGRGFDKTWMPLLVLPLLTCLLHVLCIQNYGYFRDELYYLACAKRLAWGYVDHPPLSVFLLAFERNAFGSGLGSVRSSMALASGLTVFTILLTSRRMGSNTAGLWLVGVSCLLSGLYLVIFSFYSMNALDILMWAVAAYWFVRILEEDRPAHWIVMGAVLGFGFLNKASILWLCAAMVVALLATKHRMKLKSPWPWGSVALFCALVSPTVVWQAQHGWATLEFAQNARNLKMVPIMPWDFLGQQFVVANVVAFPLMVAGLISAFRSDDKRWVPLALVFLTVLGILLVNGRSRVNYLAPAYAFVLPLVAVYGGRWIVGDKSRAAWIATAFTVTSPVYLCFGLPWLSPRSMTTILEWIPLKPPVEEKGKKSPMQGWSDMFGWQELANAVEHALDSLTPDERLQAAVVANNYGEAAALEHYLSANVICGHNAYWTWGSGAWTGRVAVLVNQWPDDVKGMFESFEQVGQVEAPFAVPEQNGSPVWIARGLKVPVTTFWQRIKKFQ